MQRIAPGEAARLTRATRTVSGSTFGVVRSRDDGAMRRAGEEVNERTRDGDVEEVELATRASGEHDKLVRATEDDARVPKRPARVAERARTMAEFSYLAWARWVRLGAPTEEDGTRAQRLSPSARRESLQSPEHVRDQT